MARSGIARSNLGFLVVFLLCAGPTLAQSVNRAQIESEIESLRDQLKAKEAQFLAPALEDQAAFADFLKQPDTGLIRLLPREKYDDSNNRKLTLRGGGAYYSFVRLTHEYGYGSDIQLQQQKFSVGFAGYDYGFFITLGELPLTEVAVEHPALRFLVEYQPPTTEPEIRAEQRKGWPGIQVGGFSYSASVPALVDATYVVRSISYDRSDVLVAFRVVRQDMDGSLTLLWRMLQKFPVPRPSRP